MSTPDFDVIIVGAGVAGCGCATLCARAGLNVLLLERATQPGSKNLSGGGANSDLFMQIFADVFGVPTCRNLLKGSASVGCAINAGIAVGKFESYEEASEKMIRMDDSFQPDMHHHAFYTQLNEGIYRQVNQHLDPLLQRLSPLAD